MVQQTTVLIPQVAARTFQWAQLMYSLIQSYTNTNPNSNATFLLLERIALGATVVTGDTTPGNNGDSLFVTNNQFQVFATSAGSDVAAGPYSITLTGTSVSSFITDVSAANIPYVSASVNSAGNIVFTHSQGGAIYLDNVTGTPVTTAGVYHCYTKSSTRSRRRIFGIKQLGHC
jgi:hypothetical protein